jgi:MerR family transcriptional regulator, light-induced transcriptional regulator
LYSDRDVAILRWIKNRIDDGISISNAANELRTMLQNGVWPETIPTTPNTTLLHSDVPPDQYVHSLYDALIHHEEARVGDILREVSSIFDIQTICLNILTPALVEIGEAWYNGKIQVTTEHFASAYIRGKLLSIMQTYPTRRSAPHIMIGGAPTEQHEIGSLMMAVLLRSRSYHIEYLGPDIPLDDLADYASYEHPDMLILTATMHESALTLRTFDARLQKLQKVPVFGFGGKAFNDSPELVKEIRGNYLGSTIDEGLNTIKKLLAEQALMRQLNSRTK